MTSSSAPFIETLAGTQTQAAAAGSPPPAKKASFLSVLGADFKKVFTWLGSTKAQAVITTAEAVGETVVNAIDPALAGIDPLINNWTQEIFKAESMAAAAAAQTGTGAQKTAIVLSTMVPQITAFATQNKLVGTDINAANNALVAFFNALGTPQA